MGWMNWERFRCITNCDKYPDECISERLFMEMADIMVSEGYKDAGYEYVNVDDCWAEMERDEDNKIVANKERFSSGIKALSDYVRNHFKRNIFKNNLFFEFKLLRFIQKDSNLGYMVIMVHTHVLVIQDQLTFWNLMLTHLLNGRLIFGNLMDVMPMKLAWSMVM